LRKPTRRDLAAPVHVRLVRSHTGRRSRIVEVSFTARVAVTNARSSYVIAWGTRNRARTVYSGWTQRDLKAGTTIRKRFAVTKPGLFRGTVRYVASAGPGGDIPIHRPDAGILVGRFAIRVP
jgi:hypothetical protein